MCIRDSARLFMTMLRCSSSSISPSVRSNSACHFCVLKYSKLICRLCSRRAKHCTCIESEVNSTLIFLSKHWLIVEWLFITSALICNLWAKSSTVPIQCVYSAVDELCTRLIVNTRLIKSTILFDKRATIVTQQSSLNTSSSFWTTISVFVSLTTLHIRAW